MRIRIALRGLILPIVLLLAAHAGPAHAGTACTNQPITPAQLAAASATAERTYAALEQVDAPLALIARHGQNLSKYGLYYSHVGFAVRDRPEGRWTVVHLLNACGTDHAGLYAQGLVNFYADDLVDQDTRIVWLKPDLARRVVAVLDGPGAKAVFDPHYSVIARYGSHHWQNSTSWVLDVLAAAQLPPDTGIDRDRAQVEEVALGFAPDIIHIAYGQRVLGGLFSANAVFTDHPLSARLAGEYQVVTVHAILRWLDAIGASWRVREWRQGVERTSPGSA
ncbi:MAG: DUF2145 domain-containing protein [Proteobacteria bacterium]|nr:DUF2145 domain-containing protein [Pseudomonadota bacterium]